MYRFSHFAAPAILGAALFVGAQGCANEHRDMPGNAQLLSEGRETASVTAPHDGTIYVYDDTSRKSLYSGRVAKGDNVKVDARDNKIMMNDHVALHQDLLNNHKYQIYFERNEAGDAMDAINARHREGETVIQGPSGSTIVQQPNGNSTTVVPPPQQPSNTTVIPPQQQPSNTTVIPPAPSNNTTVTPPNSTVAQPNGTVIQPNPNGGATVTTPPPQPQR